MWKIIRINDGKTFEVEDYKFLTFEDGRGKDLIENPIEGSSLLLPPYIGGLFEWMTSPIEEVIDNYSFKTKNSTYVLEKMCDKCKTYKNYSDFHKDSSEKDGKFHQCKSCRKTHIKIDKSKLGEKFITNEGYELEIIEWFGWINCTIQFTNGLILKNIMFLHVSNGSIKNPYHRRVWNVGYLGVGKYKTSVGTGENKKPTVYYTKWYHMLERCYDKKCQKKCTTYIDVSVCDEWHNFQNFAEWYENNWKDYMQGWQLDKDILFKGNKIYSPETCCFVPQEINTLFIKRQNDRGDLPIGVGKNWKRYKAIISKGKGKQICLGTYDTPNEAFNAYKIAKEGYITEASEKWKHLIDSQVYEALINYQVEITD